MPPCKPYELPTARDSTAPFTCNLCGVSGAAADLSLSQQRCPASPLPELLPAEQIVQAVLTCNWWQDAVAPISGAVHVEVRQLSKRLDDVCHVLVVIELQSGACSVARGMANETFFLIGNLLLSCLSKPFRLSVQVRTSP